MKDFLRTIGLLQEFTIQLDCPKSYFIQNLEKHVNPGFELFESWTSGSAFKGSIIGDKFSIRKRKRFFNNTTKIVRLNGVAQQRNDKSTVTVETNITSSLLFALIPYAPLIVLAKTTFLTFVIPATLFTAILYIHFRNAVRRAREETEREFVWMVKNYGR